MLNTALSLPSLFSPPSFPQEHSSQGSSEALQMPYTQLCKGAQAQVAAAQRQVGCYSARQGMSITYTIILLTADNSVSWT